MIKNPIIKRMVIEVLNKVPEYFFTIPASSTGKYHPSFSLGEGGLVRHTKIAVRIAYDLFTISPYFTEDDKDCIIASLILHDSCKSGLDNKSEFTVHEHPMLACELIDRVLSNEYTNTIKSCIASHMGQWSTNKYSDVVLNKPNSRLERFVHQADYLASRKFYDIFD